MGALNPDDPVLLDSNLLIDFLAGHAAARHLLQRKRPMTWEAVIGLEVHCQLSTRTKIFSGAATACDAAPNTQADGVTLGLPCGFSDGLPAGFQIMGNASSEARLLNVAHQYQQATDFRRRMSGSLC